MGMTLEPAPRNRQPSRARSNRPERLRCPVTTRRQDECPHPANWITVSGDDRRPWVTATCRTHAPSGPRTALFPLTATIERTREYAAYVDKTREKLRYLGTIDEPPSNPGGWRRLLIELAACELNLRTYLIKNETPGEGETR